MTKGQSSTALNQTHLLALGQAETPWHQIFSAAASERSFAIQRSYHPALQYPTKSRTRCRAPLNLSPQTSHVLSASRPPKSPDVWITLCSKKENTTKSNRFKLDPIKDDENNRKWVKSINQQHRLMTNYEKHQSNQSSETNHVKLTCCSASFCFFLFGLIISWIALQVMYEMATLTANRKTNPTVSWLDISG